MTKKTDQDTQFETIAVRDQFTRGHAHEHSVPLYLTSSFTFEKLANYLDKSPQVESVLYPFHPSHPKHHIAKKQMRAAAVS